MADSQTQRFINPWVLHLQKLSLELKCPLCLNLLNRPSLLPCNHIFCNLCIPRSTLVESECPACKHQYGDREIRPAPYMENIVTIYRSLDATLNASLRQSASFDAGRASGRCPISVKTNADAKLRTEHVETPQEGNSSNEQAIFSLTANKYDGIELTGKTTMPRTGQEVKLEMCDGVGLVFNDENKSIPLRSAVLEEDEKHIELGRKEINMNQMEQLSPGSSPSFGNTKDINGNSRYPVSINGTVEKSTVKRLVDNNLDSAGGERNNRCTVGANCHSRDAKRQKNLNNGFFKRIKTVVECSDHNRPINLSFENITNSECRLEPKFGESLSTLQSTAISDSPDSNRSVCGFCNFSKITDATGPMLHYANGKEVVGDVGTFSNVIHVHRKCIDWTPQVFYEGEKIKNLESELARAAKLKCSSCGQKGAALGCFLKSCRKSYHIPCALKVDCKWDCEEFLMLCPTHNSVKFPREFSMSGKHASGEKHPMSTQINDIFYTFGETLPSGVREWVFCGSALSAEEKYHLVNFASSCGATVSKCWKRNVTHVIAATDGNGACKRTLKVLMAILNGRWILTMDWIKACTEAKQHVDEEPYEVSLDNYGCCGGPKTGRLRALDKAPKLFNNLNFYFSGEFLPVYKEELLSLVTTAGGTVIESKEQLAVQSQDVQATPSTTLVIYNFDPPQCSSEEGAHVVLQRLVEAEELASEIGSRVSSHRWILDSIAACKLQPLPLPLPCC